MFLRYSGDYKISNAELQIGALEAMAVSLNEMLTDFHARF